MKRRILSGLLSLVMVLGLLPVTALAAGGNGSSGSGSGSGTLSGMSVYWDTITKNNNSITAQNSETGVSSVTITGGGNSSAVTVPHADGTKSSGWSGGATIQRSNDNNETVKVTITPADGYYITYITVCCTKSGKPANCQTNSAGDSFTGSYDVSDLGVISVDVPLNKEEGFNHSDNNGTGTYFILIAVAKIPSPLYVEYDYGDIVTSLTQESKDHSAFDTASGWTTANDGNVYHETGSTDNGVLTANTQYKYTYADNSNAATAGWKHYANGIAEAAAAEAAAIGYYFAGWKAEYFTTCNATDSTGNYNNYTYTFSGDYGTSSESEYYQPGNEVPLTTHVKLTAQWVKADVAAGTLTIKKTFDSSWPTGVTVNVAVKNSSGEQVGTGNLTTNSTDMTVSNLNPGTYTITETVSGNDNYNYNLTSATVSETNGTAGDSETLTVSGQSVTVTVGADLEETVNSDNTTSYKAVTENLTVNLVNTATAKPQITKFEKTVATALPNGVTIPEGTTVTYPSESGNVYTVTLDSKESSVTLLYKLTVTGDAGAAFSITDTDAAFVSASVKGVTSNNGTISGTIPTERTSVDIYVTKTFSSINWGTGTVVDFLN